MADGDRPASEAELRLAAKLLPYLEACGWLESRRRHRPVDRDGEPLPWLTYPAIAFLAPRVTAGMRVFEFGCGTSTLWWARRVREVVAVEHDAAWARELRDELPGNARVEHVPLVAGGDYSRFAAAVGGRFDVVVVDGRDRVNCALAALGCLTRDGVVLWDNSERRRYATGLDALAERGFRRIAFRGLAPIGARETETSVLYRDRNCLGI